MISENPYNYNTALQGGRKLVGVNNDKIIDYHQTHHGLQSLLNIEDLPESEHEFYINWVKYYSKLYKTMFKKYARIKRGGSIAKPG